MAISNRVSRRPLPSCEELKALLHHDPKTGKLFWKPRPRELFACRWAFLVWNKTYANTEAFTAVDVRGYFCGNIYGKRYQAHRIIWKIIHGSDPQSIDHINGEAKDNRQPNLRSVTDAENMRNSARPITNTSGYCGVGRSTDGKKWRATIRANGGHVHLGTFSTIEEAYSVRRAAEKRYGFHPNHGR